MSDEKKGLVHLYVGDGKGKTTAVTGLAVRALGCGKRVLFCQFLKARPTGEVEMLEQLGARTLRAKHINKFTFQMSPEELAEAAALHTACLEQVAVEMASGQWDLVVLDEVVDAVNAGLVPLPLLVDAVAARGSQVEVAMTGRNPDPQLCELADYHTEFVCHKHPWQKGVPARQGIEY